MQVIITPDGYTTDGKEVPANLFRRGVTPASPKKQWRNSPIPNQGITELGGVQLADDKKEAFASQRLFFAINLLDSVNDGNWQIVKDAFVIEVSKKDLEDIRTSKTPNKLLYRIGLVREANEFPTELIEA
jgi:hypothetical protein